MEYVKVDWLGMMSNMGRPRNDEVLYKVSIARPNRNDSLNFYYTDFNRAYDKAANAAHEGILLFFGEYQLVKEF